MFTNASIFFYRFLSILYIVSTINGFYFLFIYVIAGIWYVNVTYTASNINLLTFVHELVSGIRDFVCYNLSRGIMLSWEQGVGWSFYAVFILSRHWIRSSSTPCGLTFLLNILSFILAFFQNCLSWAQRIPSLMLHFVIYVKWRRLLCTHFSS